MSAFNIQWSATRLGHLPQERYAQFFALALQGELVYVGKAYRENLTQLIPACLRQLNLDPLSLTIHLGRIREIGMGRISGALVDSIHGMMVFAKKPRLNREGKYRFHGLMDVQATNAGCDHMPAKMRTEGNMVIIGGQSSTSLQPLLAC
jgi:hypothetical protein